MEAHALKDYVMEYTRKSRRHLFNPRTIEVPKISDNFSEWYDSVINSAWKNNENYPVLILAEDFDAAWHFKAETPVFIDNIFSANVYPQHALCEYGHFIIWDSHFWDLYSFWLVSVLDLTIKYDLYAERVKTPAEIDVDYARTKRNLTGLMLLFLTSRFDKSPHLSFVIAERYFNNFANSVPQYNQPYSLSSGKTITTEDYLEITGLDLFYDFAKQFVFLHEATHIKLRVQTSERKQAFEKVENHCKSVIGLNELAEKLDDSKPHHHAITSFAQKILNRKDNDLIEEIYCDYFAMVNACSRIVEETDSDEVVHMFLLAVRYVSLFQQWLSSSEKMWALCAEALEAENEQNMKIKVKKQNDANKNHKKIFEEMELINARNIFSFSMACYSLNINFDEYDGALASQFELFETNWFNDEFLPMLYASYAGSFVMETLKKVNEVKQSDIPVSELIRKRNDFIGWEDWTDEDIADEDASIDERTQKYYDASKNPIKSKKFNAKQKREALCRIDELTDMFNLNPNIKKYFKKGKLYY